jgi:hypothetical protein
VGVALKTLNIPGVERTMEFVLKFDKLIDCLNVSSLSAGKHSRNAFKSPYHSASDFRIKVCNCKCNTENAVIKVSFVSG